MGKRVSPTAAEHLTVLEVTVLTALLLVMVHVGAFLAAAFSVSCRSQHSMNHAPKLSPMSSEHAKTPMATFLRALGDLISEIHAYMLT